MTDAARVVLVGFMGAGKSSVGPALAELLGWSFQDLDDAIEDETGISVPELVEKGEATFREIEARVGRGLLAQSQIVIAVGGGWAAQPGHMTTLDDETVSVWLEVSPEVALERIRKSSTRRPLLEGDDPLGTARGLLEGRIPHYRRSRIRIDTEGRSPHDVAGEIVERLRSLEDVLPESKRKDLA